MRRSYIGRAEGQASIELVFN